MLAMTSSSLRLQARGLYKRLMRAAQTWEAQEVTDSSKERKYIRIETRTLFEKNRHLTDEQEIKKHLLEGEARLEMALHYRNPYPRPINIPQNFAPPTFYKKMKGRRKALEQTKPVHVQSYKTE